MCMEKGRSSQLKKGASDLVHIGVCKRGLFSSKNQTYGDVMIIQIAE